MAHVIRKTLLVSIIMLFFSAVILSACRSVRKTEPPLPAPTNELILPEDTPTNEAVSTDETQPSEMSQEIIYSSTESLTRLTNTPGDEYHTAWSPDGEWLIFTYQENGQYAIGTYNIPEDAWQLLNIKVQGDLYMDWSPDGSQFVFDAYDESGRSSIFLADFPVDITSPFVYQKLSIDSPSFMSSISPDGTQVLLFTNNQINLYDLNSRTLQPIPNTTGCWHPKFSPDGTRILATMTEGSSQDIYSFNLNNGISVKLTDSRMAFDLAQWSPDGTMIVSVAEKNGQTEIWLTNLESGEPIRLIAFPGDTSSYLSMPEFSPNGDSIVVTYQGDLWLAENISDIAWD